MLFWKIVTYKLLQLLIMQCHDEILIGDNSHVASSFLKLYFTNGEHYVVEDIESKNNPDTFNLTLLLEVVEINLSSFQATAKGNAILAKTL